MLFLVLLIGANFAPAQKIPDSALRQIKSLMDEKASRTPVQKKINSQILYKYKMQKGKRITQEVDSLQTGIEIDSNGRIKVDIVADVTQKLLNSLKKLDCEILYSSEKTKNIVANIPLDKVEQVASFDEIKNINYWIEPIVNDNFSSQFTENRAYNDFDFSSLNSGEKKKVTSFFNSESAPDFNSRAGNVRKEISEALKQKENSGTNFNSSIVASAISQGDVAHKADLARAVFGVNGSGIKIGVISDSYDTRSTGLNASDDVASGDLPGPGNPNGFTTPVTVLLDSPGGSDEGRAMLQIIHDLAPGAQLYFATAFVSQANFAQQILDLRAAGCDIIVDDITYFAEAVFQDDNVSQAVNTVTADGAIYFSSAGNSGNKNDGTAGVWEGDFNDSGISTVGTVALSGGTVHDFGGGVTNNLQTLAGRAPTLNWSDPLGGSGNDYDLYILNNSLSSVALALTNVQDGNDNPIEIGFVNVPANFQYVIFKKSGAAVRALHLNTNRGRLAINTPGVTFGHNAAASAYTVAATPAVAPGPYPGVFNSSNAVETFSSDGPRRIFFNPDGTEITPGNFLFGTNGGTALQKPDITAADGVATTLPIGSGLNPFYGTSAAAPHAAAIAGLIKSKLPAITPAQIRTALISSAIDIEAPGADRDAGAGIVMAYEALLAAGATSPNAYINLGTVNAVEGSYSNGNGSIDPGELASMTVQLLNFSTVNSINTLAVLTSSTSGVTITQGTSNYGDIPAFGSGTNTASPYLFGISSSVECGSSVNFTLTVTYDGAPAPQVINFKVKIGVTQGTISATLGSPPPTDPAYISSSGTQTNRLNRNGIIPICGVAKSTPALQEGVGTLRSYHAYTFLNNLATTQCVTVSVSSASNASIYEVVYGDGGYNPASIQSNYLADQGTTTNAAPFSFDVPALQHFTVVVHEVVSGGGVGLSYNLNVGLSICEPSPGCTPVVLTPASIPGGIVDVPYNQAFSATGGSGSYLFSLSGTLPQGINFSGNTLSGTPTEAGSFPITVTATDATGCPAGILNYTLVICPVVSAGTYGPVCSNSGLVSLGGSPSGGTWSGTGVSGSVGSYTFDPTVGTQTLTYTYDSFSCHSSSQTTIEVNQATVISVNPSDQEIFALTNTSFSVTATGTPPVTYQWQESTDGGTTFTNLSDGGVYSGSATNSLSLTNTPISMNGYKYQCVVTGACSTATSGSALLTVKQRPTTLTYSGDLTVQYSDEVQLSATLKDNLSNLGLGGRTITFTIGTQSITAVTNSSGIASASLIITQAPGTSYSVDCLFAGDVNEATSSDSDPFTITQEDARVEFTGTSIVATSGATSGLATVTLRATIQDITATSFAAGDINSGDITKARVQFYVDGVAKGGLLTPTLVNALDLKTGVVTYNLPVDIGAATDAEYTVSIKVSGYYVRDNASDNTVVTVYKPVGDFIAGGGYIKPTNTAGTYAADPGLKTNFGFSIGYNKSGKSIHGNMNFIFRRTVGGVVHTFQIKSNAITSLGVNVANPAAQIAVFVSKANLTDITNPLNIINLGGNKTLQVSMTDKGNPGSNDLIGISLYDGSTLMYSSNWAGSKTAEMLLGGGNLVVHSGFSLGSTTLIAIKSAEITTGVAPISTEPILKAYPNPFADKLTIEFSSTTDTQARLEIYSITGAKLQTIFDGQIKAGEVNKAEYLPRLISSQMILYHLTLNGQTKVGMITYQK